MGATVVTTTGFPASGWNRTRNAAIEELLQYTGGTDEADAQKRAGMSWDAAVRQFNSVAWKFNRLRQTITLVANTSDYTLATDFRSPLTAQTLDSSGNSVRWLEYVPYLQFSKVFDAQQTASASEVDFYAIRNEHQTGQVTFEPALGSTLTYPSVRIEYFRWILVQAGVRGVLNVPQDVDEAIFQLAIAKNLSKFRRFEEARDAIALARPLRIDVERTWRDYSEEGN